MVLEYLLSFEILLLSLFSSEHLVRSLRDSLVRLNLAYISVDILRIAPHKCCQFRYIGIRVAQIKSGKGVTARIIARVFDVDGIALQLGFVELAPPLLEFAA